MTDKDKAQAGAAWVGENLARVIERAHAVVADDEGNPRAPFILLVPGHDDGTMLISTMPDDDAMAILRQLATGHALAKLAEAAAAGKLRIFPLGTIEPDDDEPEGKVH